MEARAEADGAPAQSGLRFIRSCSSALAPATPGRTSSVVSRLPPRSISSATLAPRRAPSQISSAISDGVHAILAELGARGIEPAGPLQVVYHATEVLDEETSAPIEICFPVASPFPGTGEVYGTELAGGPAAVTLHRGPYAEIGPAYHTVSGWVQDHGHELAGGPREVYLNDPSQVTEADLQTEVQWPIR